MVENFINNNPHNTLQQITTDTELNEDELDCRMQFCDILQNLYTRNTRFIKQILFLMGLHFA